MQTAVDAPRRPVVRWHGGKWRLGPWIISQFPPHRIYVEPYGGGASVLIRKPRSYSEVYNDLDGEIVNVFRVLRNPSQARELQRLLRLTPFAREEFELSYISSGDPIEQARRTIARSFMGFGSAAHNAERATGFRANSNRSGTTPAHDWAHYPPLVREFTRRLTGVVIENRPALEVIQQHDGPRTLHYIDPPYVHSTRKPRQSTNYGAYEMTDDDHRDLAQVLHRVEGMVVVSGYSCALYDELYTGWSQVTTTTQGNGNVGATKRTEVLWLNPAVEAARLPLFATIGE